MMASVRDDASATSRKSTSQDQTRRLVLDYALRLLRTRGYASTTLRDIAAASGAKAGSLCYHFDFKEALTEEILSQGIAAVGKPVQATIAGLATGTDASRSSEPP